MGLWFRCLVGGASRVAHGFGFSRRGAWLGVLAGLGLVGLAVPSVAVAKVTSVTSCGVELSSPGSYRLDADVSAGGSTCIYISANDVTFNLNGHTISLSGPSGDDGIFVHGSGAKILGPGTVTGYGAGVRLEGGGGSVGGVTVTENHLGIDMASAANSVRGNVATGNDFGIAAVSGATGNTIIGNYAHGNSFLDLFDDNASCDSNVWRGNDFGTANQVCIH